MKLKMIMAACAAVCTTGAFAAATPVTCNTTTLERMINTCAPDVTFYVAGASAQSGALNNVLTAGAGIFDTTKLRGKITDTAASTSGAGNTVGYIGIGDAAVPSVAGKIVLVIYNKANGSAAGVLQLLTGKGTGAGEEITLMTAGVKTLAKGIAGTCAVTEPATLGALGVASCATEAAFKSAWGKDAQKLPQLALSDVRPSELAPGVVKKWDAAKFPSQTTGMQGFGVIVNPKLYTAMIARDIDLGRLPSTCASSEDVTSATYVVSGACQPTITRGEYSSLIAGTVSTANDLLGVTGDANKIKLFRRVDSSGTQASSNLFFAGQAGYNVKTPATDGFLPPLGAGTVGDVTVAAGSTTGDVINGVSAEAADYALGVVSLENTFSLTKASSKLKGALFVKVDGYSPNFRTDGSLDSKSRAGMQAGYPFAYEMQAIRPAAIAGAYKDISDAIINGLKDPVADLAGIAYIGSADAAKNTKWVRDGNNNLPLIKRP